MPFSKRQIPNKTRRSVLIRANFRCEDCGEQKKLDMHHLAYEVLVSGEIIDIFGRETPDDIAALCRDCHYARHRDRNGDYWRDPSEMESYWATFDE